MKFNEIMPGMWAAVAGKFSFVITNEKGTYAASYKHVEFKGEQSSNFIEDSQNNPFKTYHHARMACIRKYKELKLN